MKKIASILLIVAFVAQATSQLCIWAVFEMNRSYIAANLCINRFEAIPVCKGSCFLEKQLNENEKQQQKFPDLKTKEINLICQVHAVELNHPSYFITGRSSYTDNNISFIFSEHLRSVFRPPSAIV